jgi:F0F1-type ATP synthase membrane subunit b/b'
MNNFDDVKDAAHEATHRTKAELEKARREAAGDTMTTGEKIKSVADETKERVQAGVDHLKRDARDS